MPLGVGAGEGCLPSNPTCNETQLLAGNRINTTRPDFVGAAALNFEPTPGGWLAGQPGAPIPDFAWSDSPNGSIPPGEHRTRFQRIARATIAAAGVTRRVLKHRIPGVPRGGQSDHVPATVKSSGWHDSSLAQCLPRPKGLTPDECREPFEQLGGQAPCATAQGQVFGVWGLAIFTFSFLVNVNTTPQLATFGLSASSSSFWRLDCSSLQQRWPRPRWGRRGLAPVASTWTRMAFGEPAGFMIIWFGVGKLVVAWPGIMGTLTLEAAFILDPALNNNPLFLVSVVVLVTWIAAGMALRGLKVTRSLPGTRS